MINDYIKKISSIQNIGTNSMETYVENQYSLSPGKTADNLDWNISGPTGKKCKIVVPCESAKHIVDILKETIGNATVTYNKNIGDLIGFIQNDVKSLTVENFNKYIDTGLKQHQTQYLKYKTNKANILGNPIKITDNSIPAKVFIKGMKNKANGWINMINIGNKSVDINYEYTNPSTNKIVKEKLIDISIKDLCIADDKCQVLVGDK